MRRTLTIALASAAFASCVGGVARAQPYIGEMTRWTSQDALDPPAPGAILFTGSSSIRRWEQLTLDFADYRILQRGFGGSQFEDLNFYVNDIVLPYSPSAIVIWEGTNDLSSGEPGTEVFSDHQAFVNLVHTAQPDVEIFYLGVTPTETNGPTTAARDLANTLIAGEAAANPKLHYIDLPTYFYSLNPPSDPAFTSLYVDAIHLNRAGYDVWTTIVRPDVEAFITPNKVFVPNPLTPSTGGAILFDFGPSNPDDGNPTLAVDANGNTWNNWHPAEGNVAVNAGEHIGNLVDTDGNPTGIDLIVTGGFVTNGIVNGGLLSPNPALLGDFAVNTATQDYFFSGADNLRDGGNDDIPGGFMLDGLDRDALYEFTFFGSRAVSGTTRITEYLVTGTNVGVTTLQTTGTNIGADGIYDGNDDAVAVVSAIRPDAFGQIFVDLTVVAGVFAYVNAMEVRVISLSFASHPTNTVVDAGGILVFSASAAGDPPGVSLQWERDGVPLADDGRISGAASETLTIDQAGLDDVGVYRLVASIAGMNAVSDQAIGAVRGSPLGVADVNNDGVLDERDVAAFLLTQ